MNSVPWVTTDSYKLLIWALFLTLWEFNVINKDVMVLQLLSLNRKYFPCVSPALSISNQKKYFVFIKKYSNFC